MHFNQPLTSRDIWVCSISQEFERSPTGWPQKPTYGG
jgi:hypothetical protein